MSTPSALPEARERVWAGQEERRISATRSRGNTEVIKGERCWVEGRDDRRILDS